MLKIDDVFFPIRSVNELKEVYPGMSSSDISLLLDETQKRPYEYEPWLGFKERERAGKYVNISSEGFRYTHRKDLTLNSSGIDIYVFGGSTTFGYGVDDASTIPSHLQKLLSHTYPKKKINVFNFGRAFYYSTQELVLLFHMIRNNHVPTIALFIDGLNEYEGSVPQYSKELSTMFDSFNYNNFRLITWIIEKSSLMHVTKKIINLTPTQTETPSNIQSIYDGYLKNREMIRMLSAKYKFSAYFFVQPVPGYRNEFGNHKFMPPNRTNWVSHLRAKMALLEKLENNQDTFSLTDLLATYRGQPFVDPAHYTSEVCELIAVSIAQKIKIPTK